MKIQITAIDLFIYILTLPFQLGIYLLAAASHIGATCSDEIDDE